MGKSDPIVGKGLNSFIFQMPPYTKYKDAEGMTEYFGENWPVLIASGRLKTVFGISILTFVVAFSVGSFSFAGTFLAGVLAGVLYLLIYFGSRLLTLKKLQELALIKSQYA